MRSQFCRIGVDKNEIKMMKEMHIQQDKSRYFKLEGIFYSLSSNAESAERNVHVPIVPDGDVFASLSSTLTSLARGLHRSGYDLSDTYSMDSESEYFSQSSSSEIGFSPVKTIVSNSFSNDDLLSLRAGGNRKTLLSASSTPFTAPRAHDVAPRVSTIPSFGKKAGASFRERRHLRDGKREGTGRRMDLKKIEKRRKSIIMSTEMPQLIS